MVFSPHRYQSQSHWTVQFSPPTDKARACVTWLRCPVDSGPRITEPCRFHMDISRRINEPYRKRTYVTWLRWCSVHTYTSPRVTEQCSFHHLQKKLGLMSRDLDAPRILVPESLNLADFATYRNMNSLVLGITMKISPIVTEPWSSHHLQK